MSRIILKSFKNSPGWKSVEHAVLVASMVNFCQFPISPAAEKKANDAAFENRSSFAAHKKRRLKAVETAAFMMQEFQMKVKYKTKLKLRKQHL